MFKLAHTSGIQVIADEMMKRSNTPVRVIFNSGAIAGDLVYIGSDFWKVNHESGSYIRFKTTQVCSVSVGEHTGDFLITFHSH